MNKIAILVKRSYLTEINSESEQHKSPAEIAQMEKNIKRSLRMNNPIIVKDFRRRAKKEYTFLTDCSDSSQSSQSDEDSYNEDMRELDKRTGEPLNYTWDYVRKMIKKNEKPPAVEMQKTITQANSFIQQMRQNLQNNKQ